MPHPNSPTPPTRSWNDVTSFCGSVIDSPGGFGLPLFASTSGNHARKFDGFAASSGLSWSLVRLMR